MAPLENEALVKGNNFQAELIVQCDRLQVKRAND